MTWENISYKVHIFSTHCVNESKHLTYCEWWVRGLTIQDQSMVSDCGYHTYTHTHTHTHTHTLTHTNSVVYLSYLKMVSALADMEDAVPNFISSAASQKAKFSPETHTYYVGGASVSQFRICTVSGIPAFTNVLQHRWQGEETMMGKLLLRAVSVRMTQAHSALHLADWNMVNAT